MRSNPLSALLDSEPARTATGAPRRITLDPSPAPDLADDTAVLATGRSLEDCQKALQPQLDGIATWCRRWKVELSGQKCSYTNFTLDPAESGGKKPLDLKIQDREPPAPPTALPMEREPVFLGLTFDDQLTFRPHAKKVKARMKRKRSAL